MREYTFCYVHPADKHKTNAVWVGGVLPPPHTNTRYLEFRVFGYDIFIAREMADKKYLDWMEEHGYKPGNKDHEIDHQGNKDDLPG